MAKQETKAAPQKTRLIHKDGQMHRVPVETPRGKDHPANHRRPTDTAGHASRHGSKSSTAHAPKAEETPAEAGE